MLKKSTTALLNLVVQDLEYFWKYLEELNLYNCTELLSTNGIELCPKLKKIELEACKKLSAQQQL